MTMDSSWNPGTSQEDSNIDLGIGQWTPVDQCNPDALFHSIESFQPSLVLPNADSRSYISHDSENKERHTMHVTESGVSPSPAFQDTVAGSQFQRNGTVAGPSTSTHPDQAPILQSSAVQPMAVVGLSAPVILPPARHGGRKGPRTSLEKSAIKSARRAGICIRCRTHKKKACHNNRYIVLLLTLI